MNCLNTDYCNFKDTCILPFKYFITHLDHVSCSADQGGVKADMLK